MITKPESTTGHLLNKRKVNIYRTMIMLGALISPPFTVYWMQQRTIKIPVISVSFIFSIYFVLILLLSYRYDYIKQRLHYFVHISHYLLTAFVIYLAHSHQFSEEYAFITILVIFYIVMSFNSMKGLLIYWITTMITIMVTLYINYAAMPDPKYHLVSVGFILLSIIAVLNMSIRIQFQNKLVEAETKYRTIVEGSLVGVFIHQNGKLIYINPYMEKLSGYTRDEICAMDFFNVILEEDREKIRRIVRKVYNGAPFVVDEITVVKKDGGFVHYQFHVAQMHYNGHPALIGTAIDITERKEAEKRISYLAYYDALTGLPNRHELSQYLQMAIEDCKRTGYLMGVMFVDLDRFKMINDTLGHNVGDSVLRHAAAKLRKSVRSNDFLARYGGDEFIIVLKHLSRTEMSQVARRILNEFTLPIKHTGNELYVTPSIGISVFSGKGDDADALIRYADIAMYHAKKQAKNKYCFYYPKLNNEMSRKMKVENALRKALENNELILFYQPQVMLESGKIISAEALIRWQHPQLGLISPQEFIPMAEDTGLIVPIGKWVLENACRQTRLWHDSGLPPIGVSVNVSRVQLRDGNFIHTVNQILEQTRLEPKYLELEITESILQDMTVRMKFFTKLKSTGLKIAIDDFGVGYSSLNILQHIDIDTLKIDKSFIESIEENKKTAAIVRTIIDMGRYLNFRIIAEGIENETQMKILTKMNCELGQGFLFSRPLPAKCFENLVYPNEH